MDPDVAAVAALIREVAAAEVLPRFRRLAAADISEKSGPQDLVTTADVEAERALAARLPALVPGSLVVGEEAAAADPDLLGRLAGEAPVWLVDPVDGTANFVRGEACFAVIVAYCVGGETRAGWILDPLTDRMIWAVAGQGAWTGDAEAHRLWLSSPRPLAEMRGSLGYTLGKRLRTRIAAGLQDGPGEIVRYGCTGQEYMDLARGRLDFARYRRLKPWDHAAGVLIHAEAGGHAALVEDGRPYRPEPRLMPETVLLAPDRPNWERLRTALDAAT